MLATIPTKEMIVGQSRVKPAESFIAEDQTISRRPAMVRQIHAIAAM